MIEDLNGFETEEKVSSFRVLLGRGPDRKTLTEWRLKFYLINYLIITKVRILILTTKPLPKIV